MEIDRFHWLSNAQVKNFMPENFLEINRYFDVILKTYTIGQSNNSSLLFVLCHTSLTFVIKMT